MPDCFIREWWRLVNQRFLLAVSLNSLKVQCVGAWIPDKAFNSFLWLLFHLGFGMFAFDQVRVEEEHLGVYSGIGLPLQPVLLYFNLIQGDCL